MEEWRDIEGYEGLYQVSNEGRIKSLERVWVSGKDYNITRHHKEKIIKCGNVNNYQLATLTKDGKSKQFWVHRLVAKAFLPNQNDYPIINHKDENPSNNFVFINEDGSVDCEKSNLEWCTYKYNANYGTRNERVGRILSKVLLNNHKTSKEVCQLTLDGKLVKIWESISETGRNGFNMGSVGDCCRGYRRKAHKGYKWMYEEDYEKMLEDIASQQLS